MKKTARGFTLVELLVVITIMAIIGAYSLSSFGSFGKDQKLKSANQDIQSLIRQAQVNASTKTKCNSVNNSTWQVIFSADRKTVTLGCQESETFYPKKVLDISKVDPSIQIQNISRAGIACPTDPGLPYTINFELLTGTMNLGEPRCTSFTVSLQNTAVSSLTNSLSMTTGGMLQTRPSCDISGSQLNGLVGYWDFNEGSGTTVVDKSGYSRTGAIHGVTWTTAGKMSNALSFNGNSITINNASGALTSNDLTVMGWFRVNGFATVPVGIVSTYWWGRWGVIGVSAPTAASTSGNLSWNFVDTEGGLDTSHSLSSAAGSINIGATWYHFTATFDSSTKSTKLYLDGVKVAEDTADNILRGSSLDIYVGTHYRDSAYYSFNGLIDEVRIYNRALTADEVSRSFNSNAGCALF